MVLLNKPQRGLFAYSGNSRDIIGAVAHKGLDLQHFPGRNAVDLGYLRRSVNDVLLVGGEPYRHLVGDKLEAVAVSRGDGALSALRFSGVGERSDDVVRFVALLLHDGDSKRGEYLLDYRHLRTQLVWHCVAGALVVRIHLVPERRRMQVERHCDAVGSLLLHQLEEYVKESGQRVGRHSLFIREHAYPVERAVHYAVSVYNKQLHALFSFEFRHSRDISHADIVKHAVIQLFQHEQRAGAGKCSADHRRGCKYRRVGKHQNVPVDYHRGEHLPGDMRQRSHDPDQFSRFSPGRSFLIRSMIPSAQIPPITP